MGEAGSVPASEIARLALHKNRAVAVKELRALGYLYVTLDLMGYRMGSLNDELEVENPG